MSKTAVHDDTGQVLAAVVASMQDKKAKSIVSLDLTKLTHAVSKYFVICHAPSKTQVDAIYENVVHNVRETCGVKPFNKEGYENSEWILIDYVDVVAHIFLEDIRTFYQLEDLWADADVRNYKNNT
ncbi:MAG: ribosome silencing factor [bacterium]|jgi:ribosome-associated protein